MISNIYSFYLLLILFLITSFFSLYFYKKIANSLNLIDISKDKLHSHDTPKYGFQFFFIIIFFLLIDLNSSKYEQSIIIGYLISIFFLGYLDDRFNLKVSYRLILALFSTITFFILNPMDFFISINFNIYTNTVLLIFFSLGFIYLVNITDGLNGLVISLFLYSLIYFFFKNGYSFDTFVSKLVIFSITISFIYIIPNFLGICFLGNIGSYMVATITSIVYMEAYKSSSLEYSDILLIYYLPLLDGLKVTLNRILKGKSPFKGDFSHLHLKIRNRKKLKIVFFMVVFSPSLINYFYSDFSIFIGIAYFFIYLFYVYLVRKNS